jgi:hypothetical protein
MIPIADHSVGHQLLTLTLEGLGVTIGVTLAFSLALVGTIRATEARGRRSTAAALSWSAIAVLAYATFLGFAVLGVLVVVDK